MPEGDTIHHAALCVGAVLAGHVPDAIETPHPRFGRDRWPERLAGRRVDAVEAVGKHLLLRFEGGLVIHSHLRMTGAWRVLQRGQRWPRSPRSAWLVIRHGDDEVVQFNGPVLELLTATRVRTDPRLAGLGPDLVAPAPFDEVRFLRRLREDDPTRTFGDALLDQHIVAGIGNFWKSRGLLARASTRGGRCGGERRRGAGGRPRPPTAHAAVAAEGRGPLRDSLRRRRPALPALRDVDPGARPGG